MTQTLTFANGMTLTIEKPDYPGTRTDTWLRCFDGAYRLSLTGALCFALEDDIGPLGMVYQRVSQPMHQGGASLAECLETVRVALIGGGRAVVGGEERRIGPQEAAALVERHLANAPLDDARRIAAEVLHTTLVGRKASEEERKAAVACGGHPSEYPVLTPAWARAGA